MNSEKLSYGQKEKVCLPSIIKVQHSDLSMEIKSISNENVFLCFECQKCSSGCPLASDMDYPPSYLTHLIRLGLISEVMNTNTFWLCLSCMTCTNRCPQQLNIAKIMDALKIIAQKKGIYPAEPKINAFLNSMIGSLKTFGRVYETGMLMLFKLRTRDLFSDLDLGIKMFMKGKLKIFPSFGNRGEVKKVFNKIKEE